jgi:hypothetical protein
MVSIRSGRFIPGEEACGTHWARSFGYARGVRTRWLSEQISAPTSNRIPVVQPIAVHFTDRPNSYNHKTTAMPSCGVAWNHFWQWKWPHGISSYSNTPGYVCVWSSLWEKENRFSCHLLSDITSPPCSLSRGNFATAGYNREITVPPATLSTQIGCCCQLSIPRSANIYRRRLPLGYLLQFIWREYQEV